MNYQFIHTRNSLSLLIVLHFKINSFTTSSNVLWIRISNPRPSYPNKEKKREREREEKREERTIIHSKRIIQRTASGGREKGVEKSSGGAR